MPSEQIKKQFSVKNLLVLQIVVIFYTFSGIMGKFASAENGYSLKFFAFFCIQLMILGIYAIIWQQIIKRLPLSIAYANRATAILWSMLWACIIFGESITFRNLIGVVIVLVGTILVNSDAE